MIIYKISITIDQAFTILIDEFMLMIFIEQMFYVDEFSRSPWS